MLGIFWMETFVYKIPWNFKNSFDNIKILTVPKKKNKKLLERNVVVHFFLFIRGDNTKNKNETIKWKLGNGRVNRTIASHETEEKKNEYRINSQIKKFCCTRSTARYSIALPCSFAGWFFCFLVMSAIGFHEKQRLNIFALNFFFLCVLKTFSNWNHKPEPF